MNIAEKPIAAIIGRRTSTGDGIHMIANSYRKGFRIETHMHREAQLVYAARGTMQVTTPKGRWLVPPDRAVWVPALSEHAIDVLADIEMRTLYFELDWLRREARSHSLEAEFVVRVSPLLQKHMTDVTCASRIFTMALTPLRAGSAVASSRCSTSCVTPQLRRPARSGSRSGVLPSTARV